MIERRFVTRSTQLRAERSGSIDGHAAVFDEEYVLWQEEKFSVVETVKRGAFARAIKEKQDVRCLFNHNPDHVLGRTKSGTLQLREDSIGLYFKAKPPEAQVGRDVYAFVDRGDVSGCSFAFRVTKENVTETKKQGKVTRRREIQDVDLYDVGPVTYPAYSGTDVGARSMDLRSSLFPEGVPARVLRLIPCLGTNFRSIDDSELILLDMDLRLRRAGLVSRL